MILTIWLSRQRILERFQIWRCSRFVMRNRRKHPDLISQQRDGVQPFVVAQRMARRENERVREEMARGWTGMVSDVWDFMIPRNGFELSRVLARMREWRRYATR